MSMAAFLNKQSGVHFTHEKIMLTHTPAYGCWRPAIEKLLARPEPIVGDINPAWLSYVDPLLDEFPNTKILFLAQYYEQNIVDSFWDYKSQDKALQMLSDDGQLWHHYPFDAPRMSKEMVALSVGRYIRHMGNLFMITQDQHVYVYTHTLNDPATQDRVLEWIGLPKEDRVYGMERKNQRAEVLKLAERGPYDPSRGVAGHCHCLNSDGAGY